MNRKLFFILFIFLAIPSLCAAENVEVRVSSIIPQAGINAFNASVLSDGDDSTGWIENISGNATGQWVQFVFPKAVVVDSIVFRNGVDSDGSGELVSRVKGVHISFAGVHRQSVTLKDIEQKQKIEAVQCRTESLELVIDSVYSNAANCTAGFSEILVEYHEPTAEELKTLVLSKNVVVVEPQMSAKEKKVLAEKMRELEEKKKLLSEVKDFFDKFYTAFVTIDKEYPRMFVQSEFLRESSYFESFRAMLAKRGVLQKYQGSIVSTSGLRYSIRTHTANEVELWVKGEYTVIFDLRDNLVTENSLFVLKKELGEWKVKSKVEF